MITESMNIQNVVRGVTSLQSGRCKTAATRLNSTLAALSGKSSAVRMAQALAFIGNEVGKLPTFIAETSSVDDYVIGANSIFDAKLLRHLGEVELTHIPATVKLQLKKAGWKETDVLKGARICFYPDANTEAVREDFDLISVFQWKALLIVCDRTVTTVARITDQRAFDIVTQAHNMQITSTAVGNGGNGSSIAANTFRTLQRILGYLRTYDTRPNACSVGHVPEPTMIDNSGVGSHSTENQAYYTGTWHRPHLRRAHYRIYNKGRKNERKVKVHGSAIHGLPILLRDEARENGTVRTQVVNM